MGLERLVASKQAKENFLGFFVFATVLFALFSMSFVLADFDAGKAGVGSVIVLPDDTDTLVNITINNSDATGSQHYNISTIVIDLNHTGATINYTDFSKDTDVNGTANYSTFVNNNNHSLNFSGFSITNFSTYHIWFNVTGVVPGDYNFSVWLFNASINYTEEVIQQNISVHVNDTFTVDFGAITDVAYANVTFLSQTNYTLTGNETGVSSNVSISNESRVLQSNITIAFSEGNFVINWSEENLTSNGLPDGVYFINISGNSTNLDDTTPAGRKVTIDTTAPTVALASNSDDTTRSKIVGDITITDATVGIGSTCSVDNTEATITGTGTAQTLTHDSVACGTSVEYTITCVDRSGNVGTKTASLATNSCGGGGGSSGGGGGSSSSSSSSDDDEVQLQPEDEDSESSGDGGAAPSEESSTGEESADEIDGASGEAGTIGSTGTVMIIILIIVVLVIVIFFVMKKTRTKKK